MGRPHSVELLDHADPCSLSIPAQNHEDVTDDSITSIDPASQVQENRRKVTRVQSGGYEDGHANLQTPRRAPPQSQQQGNSLGGEASVTVPGINPVWD